MKNRSINIYLSCLFYGIGLFIFSTTSQAQRAPTLRANVVSYQQVDLSWDRLPASVEVFVVERKEDGPGQVFAPISGNLPGTTFSYQDKTVQENRNYVYRVNATCDKSCGATLNEVKVTTPIAPAATPSNLEAFYISGRGMAITWQGNNSDGATFLLERNVNGGGYNLLSRVPYSRSLSYADAATSDGNTYCYRVKAVNSSGESGYSNESCVSRATPKPNAPSGLSANAANARQINLAWTDNAGNEMGFEIERSTDGTNFAKIGDAGPDAKSYEDKGVNPKTKYWYRIRAKNGGGVSDFSNVADATTPDEVPNVPQRLSANAVSNTQIDLSWADVSGNETGFELERSTDGRSFSKLADLPENATSYSNTGLATLTKYWYRIRAKNNIGNSEFSNVADATTFDVPPGAPTNLTAKTISSSQISLSWKDNATNEGRFELERSTDGTSFAKVADIDANKTTYENTGLQPATKYWYRVRSVNGSGPSIFSNTADATTMDVAPNAPQRLNATPVSNTQIDLSWGDVSGNETGFELERSTDGRTFSKLADLPENATSYSNTGLTTLTKYWYRIRAKNNIGNSEFSNIADATTFDVPPGAPTNLTAKTISSSQISLSWKDNATNEAKFELESSTDGTKFSKIADIDANTTTYENTGLQPATKYWYRVRSVNRSGPSIFSNVADATTLDVKPNAPGRLSATTVNYEQINLAWEDLSGNEAGFQIEISTNLTAFNKIADVGANVKTYQAKGLKSETKYYFRIRAVNAIGTSDYSNVADATTTKAPIPDAPTNLTAVPLDFDLVQLRWSALTANATEVIIERSKSKDKDFKQIGRQAASIIQFPDREILDVADYFYRIKAVNQAGSSRYSDVAQLFAASIITGTEPANAKELVYCSGRLLMIELGNQVKAQGHLYDLKGRKCLDLAFSGTMKADLTQFSSGIYIVVIETEKMLIRQKIALY